MSQKNLEVLISLKRSIYWQFSFGDSFFLNNMNYTLNIDFLESSLRLWQIVSESRQFFNTMNLSQKKIIRTLWKKKLKKKTKKTKTKIGRLLLKIKKIKKTRTFSITSLFFLKELTKKKEETTPRNLSQRVLIKTQSINENFLQTYYKLNKKNNKIKIPTSKLKEEKRFVGHLKNYHNKPYWALRTARIVHWNLFTNKTLRQQRYKGFLRLFLRKYSNLAKPYIFIINSLICQQISPTKLREVTILLKNALVQTFEKNMFQIPLFFSKLINWTIFKKKNKKIKKIVGRWGYLKFKKFSLPWLQKKKNFPKVVKQISPNIKYFKLSSYYDPLTGYVYLNNLFKKENLSVLDISPINFLVKLHIYRYNPNSLCLLHFHI